MDSCGSTDEALGTTWSMIREHPCLYEWAERVTTIKKIYQNEREITWKCLIL